MNNIRRLFEIQRHMGAGWVFRRAAYHLKLKSGHFTRCLPLSGWSAHTLSSMLKDRSLSDHDSLYDHRRKHGPAFFFNPSQRDDFHSFFQSFDPETAGPQDQARDILRGRISFFSGRTIQLGLPLDWHRNALSGQRAPHDLHWSQLGDFGFGDIKNIWELSRFSFAYPLVRAYWRSGDEDLAEFFWSQVEHWRQHNPPQAGVNWKCGQEISFRIMAWCFGLYGFGDSPATTPTRVAELTRMMGVFGQRIQANLAYALNQQNNHGISEAMGLFTIGTLFPELSQAARWQSLGAELLEKQAQELIYDDGAFCQHSLNYHRLALQDYLWAWRLGHLNHRPLSRSLGERLTRSVLFLYGLQDQQSGRLPNYGNNDGSLLLPLSNCPSTDFRPVLQAAHFCLTGKTLYPSGPWDEDLLWLCGPSAVKTPVRALRPASVKAAEGGYFVLRDDKGLGFVRSPSFRHRPGHADLLHVDLWWKGRNVALDPGTFSYNAPPPWDNPLVGSGYHNTVCADGLDQMERFSRFMWLPWPNSYCNKQQVSAGGLLQYWEGGHDGYARLRPPVIHRRAMASLGRGWWLVLDQLRCQKLRDYRLHWLMPDAEHHWDPEHGQLRLELREGDYQLSMGAWGAKGLAGLVRADPDSPRGWRTPTYQEKQPALSVDFSARAQSLMFYSVFGPGYFTTQRLPNGLHIQGTGFRAEIATPGPNAEPQEPLARHLRILETTQDELIVSGNPDITN